MKSVETFALNCTQLPEQCVIMLYVFVQTYIINNGTGYQHANAVSTGLFKLLNLYHTILCTQQCYQCQYCEYRGIHIVCVRVRGIQILCEQFIS